MFNGKINVIFGFIFFASTAVLGPAVLIPGKGEVRATAGEAMVEAVEEAREGGADEGVAAAVAIADFMAAEKKVGSIGSAVHAHGNLESLLNIVVGFILISLCIPYKYKKLISVVFITGAVFHSGMLYLGIVFKQYWAFNFTIVGAVAIVAGLLMMAGACIVGLKSACDESKGAEAEG